MEQLISFEVAKLAKELGFDKKCDKAFYDNETECNHFPFLTAGNHYFRPTQAVLAKWLREVYRIYISMDILIIGTDTIKYSSQIIHPKTYYVEKNNFIGNYEEVLEDSLLKALKYLKSLSQENPQKKEPKKK